MEEFGINIFESINFYERYKSLSDKTRNNERRLEKTDKKQVLAILEKLDYKVKYVSKGNFYKIVDSLNNWTFNIHFSLKYGLVEIILGCKNNISEKFIGGASCVICEDIEYSKNIKSEELIKDPSFDNYETLQEIFKEALSLYEDMKREALKLSHPA